MKLRHARLPFALAFLVILATRIFEFFQISQKPVSAHNLQLDIVCFATAFAAFVVGLILAFFLGKDADSFSVIPTHRKIGTAICAMIFAVFCLVDACLSFYHYITVERSFMYFILGILAVIATVSFVFWAISFFIGKNRFVGKEILTLMPVFYILLKLFVLFSNYSSLSLSPWQLTDEVAIVFLVLFFLNLSRAFSGIEVKNLANKLLVFGLSSALFFVDFILRSIAQILIAYNGHNLSTFYPNIWSVIVFAGFIPFLIAMAFSFNKRETVQIPPLVVVEDDDNEEQDDDLSLSDIVEQNRMVAQPALSPSPSPAALNQTPQTTPTPTVPVEIPQANSLPPQENMNIATETTLPTLKEKEEILQQIDDLITELKDEDIKPPPPIQ